jgi:alpha-tubulin suppressor-like RCC1 family protein
VTCATGFVPCDGDCIDPYTSTAHCARFLTTDDETTCARKGDGTLWCWGWGGDGQFGDGTTTGHRSPKQVTTLGTSVSQAVLGSFSACAILQDATLSCWGSAVMGNGSSFQYDQQPTRVMGLDSVKRVASHVGNTCAIKNPGVVYCWGNEASGPGSSLVPELIPGLDDTVDQVTIGGGSSDEFNVCARKNDATVWCWGPSQSLAAQVTQVTGPLAEVAIGSDTTCVRKMDNTVWCWGNDTSAEQITSLGTSARQLAVNGDAFCVRKDDGTLWCWGFNNFGQVGDGTTTPRAQPVQVSGLADVAEVAVADLHVCARKKNGTVWCWGYNARGELGDGTATNRLTPVQVNITVP